MDRTKTCLSRSLLVFKKGGEKRMYVLPSFKGYTVDERLSEFRKAKYGESLEFISFKSIKGKNLLSKYRKEQTMMILTKEIINKLPPLYSQENEPDPMVICKFFFPDFSWTWYVIEFDGKDTFYGLVDGFEEELGYFTLTELLANRGQLGLPIERDRFFTPKRLSEVRKS